jgi:hypothetical protein
MKTKYPECEKMAAVKDKSQIIGEFLEWLTHERLIRVELCVRNDIHDNLIPCYPSTEELLAEFFDIDLNKIEKEKRQMLDELRRK